ncbi:malonic semialdehyde reductase [Novipirellula galeiformis]|uniref:Malonic semialdehyde reductase n=1 Tax=Novipirellula galeiformis TaxID=2528004 RepID=A0A5C6CNI4_9BACT|nr:nitroreductase family protein [Novipirellula galeiformis]TWU24941.1 malonic semialdehyde reductase [Novipirellula galeiformis]
MNPTQSNVLDAIQNRYSPYRFEPREVEDDKILACLEAARWAASSFNDQPWNWIVARRQDTVEFETMIDCLMEANQDWARQAGALLITVNRTTFRRNQKHNRVALHDLGQASAYLALQAAELGLQAHQMGGVNLSRLRQQYEIPQDHEPQTAIAIGYPDRSEPTSEQGKAWQARENSARQRLSLSEQTFVGKWGVPAEFVKRSEGKVS